MTTGAGAHRCWVHVSTLMNWNRPPVGVVRVEQEYCAWVLSHSGDDQVRFCLYDRRNRVFREVSRDAVRDKLSALAAQPSPAGCPVARSSWKKSIGRLARRGWRRVLPWLSLQTAARLRDFALNQIARAQVLVMRIHVLTVRIGRRLRRRTPSPADGAEPLKFERGDAFLSMGLDWEYLDQQELYRLRKVHSLRVILLCYDVIPVLYPHLVVQPPDGFAAYLVDLAWCADEILCISGRTRRDLEALLRRLGAPVPELRVFRLGADSHLANRSSPPPGFPHGDGERPFVLYVSTIERRKNHEILYRAWTRLRDSGFIPYRLVFVGMRGWGVGDLLQDIALDRRVQDDIIILDHVDDAHLQWLYRHCAFTVYPSLYEGWGLPVVESLAAGKFSLVSDAGSLPEAGGDLVEYLDPWDLPAWVDRLHHHMSDPGATAAWEERIADAFVVPAWADTARTIHQSVRPGMFRHA